MIQILAKLRIIERYCNPRQGWKFFVDNLKLPPGDRDILTVHRDQKILWVAEVEGDSSGQPEGKIYKALGQLICAIS